MTDWGAEAPEEFDHAIFSSGIEKRVTVILLLDTSESMGRPRAEGARPIDELNESLVGFGQEMRSSTRLKHRAEVAVITFGNSGVKTSNLSADGPFCAAGLFVPPSLEAKGVTPMVEGIQTALALCESRKRELDSAGIARFRPLIFMITDGAPTDSTGTVTDRSALAALAAEIADLEARKKVAFFGVGVRGADIGTLRFLVPQGYWDLRDGSFADFLKLVSTSVGATDPITSARQQIFTSRRSADSNG